MTPTTQQLQLAYRVCRTLEGVTLLEEADFLDLDKLRKFWDQVYCFTHLVSNCSNPHTDWLKKFEELEKDIELAAYTSPKEREEKEHAGPPT